MAIISDGHYRNSGAACQPTIVDIARLAKVSTATVSRTLNGYPGVSKNAKEAVERAAALFGYTPNPSAVTLGKANAGQAKKRHRNNTSRKTGDARTSTDQLVEPAATGVLGSAKVINGTLLTLEIDLREVKRQRSGFNRTFLLRLRAQEKAASRQQNQKNDRIRERHATEVKEGQNRDGSSL